jgi:VIT1/CCC1 family predicted Fe2+/Mn2+ transporter
METVSQPDPNLPAPSPQTGEGATNKVSNNSKPSLIQKVKTSFSASIGDIVFGMEDGTVSIFGLVFGVAASSTNGSAVLLAGATGAISAAVSMMAGTFLEVESARDQAKAQLAQEEIEIKQQPEQVEQEISQQLTGDGFSAQDVQTILATLKRTPGAMLRYEAAFKLQLGKEAQKNPFVQSLWMFGSDVIAAFIPVIPFALFPLDQARTISIIITGLLLILLGIGRGLVGNRNVLLTALETLLIASIAAGAGMLIGKLITG